MRLNAFLALGRALSRVPGGTATFYNWLSHLEFQPAISHTRSSIAVDRRRLA